MSQKEDLQTDQPTETSPRGTLGRRAPRSGEGMESVLTHLREQESQRVQDDPTSSRRGASSGN